jgi:hexosaminidase
MSDQAVLLPAPQKLKWTEGNFHCPDLGIILLNCPDPQAILSAGAVVEKVLWTQLRLNWELNAASAVPEENVKVQFSIKNSEVAHSQSYKLSIKPKIISVESRTPTGLYYGAQTLAQLVTQFGREIPCLEIEDWPDIEHRGVMLDISRDKVYKNETLYELVDRLASIKINQLQLYTEHTFAYHNHPDVWREASPMTGEDILALDRYCRERFIELVPNQNSFGHMTRWLKHDRYAPLAEIHGEFQVPWGIMSGPFSLAPDDPASLAFISGLFDELLPHFSSKTVNIGCDETFDLGAGKSKEACESRGVGSVYLDYLLKLYENLNHRGFTVQFWGDIILQHPDLVSRLPKDMVALEWGYEAGHPFADHGKIFAESGLPYYVCPGTSSWNTISGRTDNALKNLINAAENGKKNHALGYLITDWGDSGHWQVLPINFLGIAMGAAYSWAVETNQVIDVPDTVSRFMFDDPSGHMGRLVYDLGNVHQKTGILFENSSVFFYLLQTPMNALSKSEQVTAEVLARASAEINQIMQNLTGERMTRSDAEIIRSEMLLSARMLQHACRRGICAKSTSGAREINDLKEDLLAIMQDYRKLWLIRNRPGGLSDSMRRMETMLIEYQ